MNEKELGNLFDEASKKAKEYFIQCGCTTDPSKIVSTTVSNTSNGDMWYTTTTNNYGWGVMCGCTDNRKDFIPTKIIFNPPATICYFPDGTKTVVKCADDEEFCEEEGVMACIIKKIFTSRNQFKKLVKEAYRQPKDELKTIKKLTKKAIKTGKPQIINKQHLRE